MYNHIVKQLNYIKAHKPLILNLTNYVTMDFVANGLLSIGASPIMSVADEEIDDLLAISQVLTINFGTLNDSFITRCHKACLSAKRLNRSIVFDPVGAGASSYRTTACLDLLEQFECAVIRGNASEIMALCGAMHTTKGVDSTLLPTEVIAAAKALSKKQKAVIVISGATDAVILNEQVTLFERGSPLMPMVTGSGCLLTAIISAFVADCDDTYAAAGAAVLFYSICGELAANKASGPGSFRSHFLDTLAKEPMRADYEPS
jgi:hydroxyethylthiazole kinase